ncbi:MAG: flagellar hook-associated protein FlgK [Gammaproteobacteria bacterium]|nr:flagellar hook-associated protein FlgK [Gammaproteobacteria bacterium]
MSDLLGTSLSGMQAFQRAMEVTANNISNANTPGYSRQISEFTARPGVGGSGGYVGSGTQISSVKRIYDVMLGEQLRTATTGFSRFSTLNTLSSRLDSLLADPNTGLSSGLQSFFSSVQDVANDPGSIPARQALLGEANGVVQRFLSLDQRFAETESEVNQRISRSVEDINFLAGAIANINDKIALAGGRGGQQPNDLLDQRDMLVRQLAEQVSVTTTKQDDGTLSVFIGSGQTLVIGTDARELAVQGSRFDPTRLEVVYKGIAGSTPLDTSLAGGTLGGLLEFRSQTLDQTRQSLGQTAVAFAQSFNEQHASGMDLRGALGGDFFSIAPPSVLASGLNTGSGTAIAAVTDLSALTGEDYILDFDGASYRLARAGTGEAVPMTGSGTAADPFLAEGLSIEVGGAPAAGDQMMIRTGRDAAASIGVLISDPQAIAMAAPTRTRSSVNNLGDATISATTTVDSGDPALLTTSVIEFTGPSTYSIDGAGAFAYTNGAPITVNGAEFTISGVPQVGDQFTLEPNFGASGDNGNGLLLGDVQSVGILDGGSISITGNYGQLVADVGGTTRQVRANLDAQNVVLTNVEDAQLSRSGVNIDEEAANLIRFQQAYQASAQVISVASTLFDTLLNATRR